MCGLQILLDNRRIRPNDIEHYTNDLVHGKGKTQIHIK